MTYQPSRTGRPAFFSGSFATLQEGTSAIIIIEPSSAFENCTIAAQNEDPGASLAYPVLGWLIMQFGPAPNNLCLTLPSQAHGEGDRSPEESSCMKDLRKSTHHHVGVALSHSTSLDGWQVGVAKKASLPPCYWKPSPTHLFKWLPGVVVKVGKWWEPAGSRGRIRW